METDFQQLMSGKSEEQIQQYLDNYHKYIPQAIEAALAELQSRGRVFSDEELATIRERINERRTTIENNTTSWTENQLQKNVVTDEAAPIYYSQTAIYIFTALFSVIFGSILLAINLRKNHKNRGVIIVVAFGVLYSAVQMWALSYVPRSRSLTLVSSIVGAVILNRVFWNKYIGKDAKYRARPIWVPLIIAIVIAALLFIVIYNTRYQ